MAHEEKVVTVAELIAMLQKLPQTAVVCREDDCREVTIEQVDLLSDGTVRIY